MSDLTTPETDAAWKEGNAIREWTCRKLERERDEARRKLNNLDVTAIHSCHNECQRPICVLRRERDEAREKVEQQRKEIVRLNGATNHAGGTPLKIALRERDEANEELHKQLVQFDQLFDEAEKIRIERDEAREELNNIRINLGEDADGYTLLHAVCVMQNERDEVMEKLSAAWQSLRD